MHDPRILATRLKLVYRAFVVPRNNLRRTSELTLRIKYILATIFMLASGEAFGQQPPANFQRVIPVRPDGSTIDNSATASSSAASGITPSSTQSPVLVAKGSPGNLYGYNATAGATAGFVAVLNATAAPAASAPIAPLECSAIPANGTFRARQDIPDRYTVGIVLIFTSSCTTYTAVTPAVLTAVIQ